MQKETIKTICAIMEQLTFLAVAIAVWLSPIELSAKINPMTLCLVGIAVISK